MVGLQVPGTPALPGMGGMGTMRDLPPIGWHSLLTQWDVGLGWTAVALALLLGYLAALPRAQAAPAGFPVARVAAYVVGVVLLWLSVSSAVGVYAESVFYLHMVQHLLLITVVPALLVLGHPLTVLDRAVGGGRVGAVLRSGLVALVTHPVVGLGLYAAVIVGTHLTGFMDQMMGSAWLAPLEQALYLVAGYLYVLPVLGDEPVRWHPARLMRVGLLVLGMVPDTVVGIVLLQSDSNPFPAMLSAAHPWAPDPVRDVQTGGGLMWALGDGLMMLLAVGVVVAMVTGADARSPVGPWLEGVRRSTLQQHTGESGGAGFGDYGDFEQGGDVDDDDAALEAYNAMLRRMSGHRET